MALKLFVDPSEGARAYARGIEKAGDAIGKSIGGILESYNERREKNEASLGMLVAEDPDGISRDQPGFMLLKPKEQNDLLANYYSDTYSSLKDKQGKLQKIAVDKEKEDEKFERISRAQQTVANQLKIDIQRNELNSREAASKRAAELVAQSFSFTHNLLEDRDGVVQNLFEAESLLARYPDIAEANELSARIAQTKSSPGFTAYQVRSKAASDAFASGQGKIPIYNSAFASEIADGKMTPVDQNALRKEVFEGRIDGPEMLKIRQAQYADSLKKHLSESPVPGIMLDIIGVPTLQALRDEGRTPSIGDIEKLETFNKKYAEKDKSLFSNVTDVRGKMVLSEMNEDSLTQADETELKALLSSAKGIDDILGMLGSGNHQDFKVGDRVITTEDFNRVGSVFEDGINLISAGTYQENIDRTAFRAKVQSLVANIAKGVFGETGVLTNEDFAKYEALLATPKNTNEANLILSNMLLDTIRDKAGNLFGNAAANGKDVSGYIDVYNSMQGFASMTETEAVNYLLSGKASSGEKLDIGGQLVTVKNPEVLSQSLIQELKNMKGDSSGEKPKSASTSFGLPPQGQRFYGKNRFNPLGNKVPPVILNSHTNVPPFSPLRNKLF